MQPFAQVLPLQDKVEEAQKHVDRISDELAAVRKAAKKLEEDGVLTSKRDKASLDELRQHLASARQEADASKSQLQEVCADASIPDWHVLMFCHVTHCICGV